MARKRAPKPVIGKKTKQAQFYAEHEDVPDPKSNEYYFNEIDDFHSKKEKILLENGAPLPTQDEDIEDDKKAVMDLEMSDEDFEDEEDLDVDSDLDDDINMESDLEEEDDGMPSDKAWGKQKRIFYNTDYSDKDYMGMSGLDGESAEAEEKEALALQKKMAQTLQDADFGLSDFVVNKKVTEEDSSQKIIKNFSKMSKKEKLQLLSKESPEFLGVIEDFNEKFFELLKIQPITSLVEEGKIPNGAGALYLKTKHSMLLMYLVNISFYFMLKACHVSIQNHPITKRLVECRLLFQHLESVDEKLKPEINDLLKRIKDGEEIPVFTEHAPDEPCTKSPDEVSSLVTKIKHMPHKESIQKDVKNEGRQKKMVKFSIDRKQSNETECEKRALELYDMMKDVKCKTKPTEKETKFEEEIDTPGSENEVERFADDDNGFGQNLTDAEDDEFDEKRGITYQIAKNKGLTPHRKKEQRNPRVKHRTKFRKAKIRRKGQVREPRLEINKYGGEISGIRAGVRHSIKIK